MSGWSAELLLGGVVVLGASVQWLTGMGFALVAVPALILLLGPGDGVALANCASGAICLVGLTGGWANVRLRAMVPLVLAAACTVPLGSWVTHQLSEPALLVAMGGLVTAAVLLVMSGLRVQSLDGLSGALAAGATGASPRLAELVSLELPLAAYMSAVQFLSRSLRRSGWAPARKSVCAASLRPASADRRSPCTPSTRAGRFGNSSRTRCSTASS